MTFYTHAINPFTCNIVTLGKMENADWTINRGLLWKWLIGGLAAGVSHVPTEKWKITPGVPCLVSFIDHLHFKSTARHQRMCDTLEHRWL